MRILLRVLAIAAIPFGIAAFYSVYADEPGLETTVRKIACAKEGAHCRLRLARLARTPFKRAFVFVGGDGRVEVDCRRSMVLVGEYACVRNATVDY